MAGQVSVRTPERLLIRDGEAVWHGANQIWYRTWWQRASGCGPTNCSHLLWYLAQTRPNCRSLCGWDASGRDGMLRLMREVWKYVTPTTKGVDNTGIFIQGAMRYGQEHGAPLHCRVMDFPDDISARPAADDVAELLSAAFAEDLPVAFLNRSCGALDNLDSWHWVTLVAVETATLRAEMYDQGRRTVIDLGLWIRTAAKGGGLVAMEPQ